MDKNLIQQALPESNSENSSSSSISRNLPTLSQESWAVEIRRRYHTSQELIDLFSPDQQPKCELHSELSYTGGAPTLARVTAAYGEGVSESWLIIQIQDLYIYESVNYEERATVRQIDQTAQIICANYPYLKLTELMLFFSRFKAGRYGKPYGNLSGREICAALGKFIQQRSAELDEIERSQRAARIASERRQWAVDSVTRDEYDFLRLMLNYGYERRNFTPISEMEATLKHIENEIKIHNHTPRQ